jgi:hypothetical protein
MNGQNDFTRSIDSHLHGRSWRIHTAVSDLGVQSRHLVDRVNDETFWF